MADVTGLEPTCPPLHRPEALFAPGTAVQGLRAAQARMSGTGLFLDVWLYQDPPTALADPTHWIVTSRRGAAPVTIQGASVQAAPTPHIELALAGTPEPTLYRLEVRNPSVDFDPLRTWLPVRLLPSCDALGSCAPVVEAPAPPRVSPVHDYLARDWRSLRRALIEFLVREHPDADLSIADPTITLLELFAHVGDLLHYRLDRVATEAYLETARLRTSVRRHARLVDYHLGEAISARTYVHVVLPAGDAEAQPILVPVPKGSVAVDDEVNDLVFVTDAPLEARTELGEIPIYDWGEDSCWLPEGATECVLVRPVPADHLGDAWLSPGDLLVFEVVDPQDSEAHRQWASRQRDWPLLDQARFRAPLPSRTAQVVALTSVDRLSDPLLGAGMPLYRVVWSRGDALATRYPVAIDASRGGDEVVVARANLAPCHHGRLVDAERLEALPSGGYPLISAGDPSRGGLGLAFDENGAPQRLDVTVTLPSGLTAGAEWVETLVDTEQSSSDFPFLVDVEEFEAPTLRFRTGAVGFDPPSGSAVVARYEVGGGSIGNIPANALHGLLLPDGTALAARNPTAAVGGRDRTPLAVARRDAPEAFAVEALRAVIASDYAAAAGREPGIRRAVTRRKWSGAWPVMSTVVDLDVDADDVAADTVAGVAATLDNLRMIGVESVVVEGAPVGLMLSLEVCVVPGFDPDHIRAAILQLLRPGSDASPGLFHHSRMALGASVYLSAVLAAVASVPGVDAVEATQARRLSDPVGTVLQVIAVGPYEMAVLDDDPARPERGRLDIVVRGQQ